MKEQVLWLPGGDGRQRELGRLLAQEGHMVREGPSCPEGCTLVVLPMPVSREEGLLFTPEWEEAAPLDRIFSQIPAGAFLCGGRVSPRVRAAAEGYGLDLRDYAAREDFLAANAVPTAEGAVQLAMEELPITIQGARVLVLGFGRVGRAAARAFQALGAEVTVAARRESIRCEAEKLGLTACGLVRPPYPCQDLVVNTVPAPLLTGETLAELGPETLILDLASAPGGVEFEAARALGLRAIHALALPGRVAPRTAAAIVRDTIFHMLDESEQEENYGT